MAITSVEIDGLELVDPMVYGIGRSTAWALEASVPYEAITVEMKRRAPHFVRSQPIARTIPIVVFLLDTTYAGRLTAYDALLAKFGPGIRPLRWTRNGTTYELQVSTAQLVPSDFLNRATSTLTAWDPVAVVV